MFKVFSFVLRCTPEPLPRVLLLVVWVMLHGGGVLSCYSLSSQHHAWSPVDPLSIGSQHTERTSWWHPSFHYWIRCPVPFFFLFFFFPWLPLTSYLCCVPLKQTLWDLVNTNPQRCVGMFSVAKGHCQFPPVLSLTWPQAVGNDLVGTSIHLLHFTHIPPKSQLELLT